ncbi:MAG: hypothetical protein CMN53_00730 [SAR116 cluster bacterium]|nr:hypothetical protein [SAR116 cluster bacterium]
MVCVMLSAQKTGRVAWTIIGPERSPKICSEKVQHRESVWNQFAKKTTLSDRLSCCLGKPDFAAPARGTLPAND